MARKIRNANSLIGEEFNPEQMNIGEAFDSLADVLEYYRPRGFAPLRDDLRDGARAYESCDDGDSIQIAHDAATAAEELLTEWARNKSRCDYVYFAWDGDFCGFRIDVDSAISEADWIQDDRHNGRHDELPRGATGLLIRVSDHGNVSAYRLSRGRERELFAVV